jgi:hypothetical protein
VNYRDPKLHHQIAHALSYVIAVSYTTVLLLNFQFSILCCFMPSFPELATRKRKILKLRNGELAILVQIKEEFIYQYLKGGGLIWLGGPIRP